MPLLGYAGDKVSQLASASSTCILLRRLQVGYRAVLGLCLVLSTLTGQTLTLLPHYAEHSPKVAPPSLLPHTVHRVQAAVIGFNVSAGASSPPWTELHWLGEYTACRQGWRCTAVLSPGVSLAEQQFQWPPKISF
jgi:hypothetical protein